MTTITGRPHFYSREVAAGFTLIEMSVVLVIIGLIAGGILAGRDLITAAAMRAQISQIEKYNVAVNIFRNKYNGIPGDISSTAAGAFGFQNTSCGINQPGNRDGNGFINGAYGFDDPIQEGENMLFWQDLSVSGLIDGIFPNSGGSATSPCQNAQVLTLVPGSGYMGNFFPAARIGYGNFVFVYDTTAANWSGETANWYDVTAATSLASNGGMFSTPSIPVMVAYNMDKKMDDGIPNTGNVQAVYENNYSLHHANAQASDSATSCFNNTTNTYSISINGGNGKNCSLSFKFQ